MSNRTELIIDPKFPNLKPDFGYLEQYLPEGKTLQEILENHHIPRSEKMAKTVKKEDAYMWTAGDRHGNLADHQWLMADFISGLANGYKGRFVGLGDITDPLFEYQNGELVTKDINDPEGMAMFKKNLSVQYKDKKTGDIRLAILAYPDDSVQILAQYLAFKKYGGDLWDEVQDDHGQPIQFPGNRISKSGIDLTNVVLGKLTDEEKEYARRELARRPLIYRTETGWGFSHTAGPLDIKLWKELEDYNIFNDIEPDTEGNVFIKEGSVLDMLTWGIIKEMEIDTIKNNYRYFPKEGIENTMRKLGINNWIIGHSGVASRAWEHDDVLIPELNPVDKVGRMGRLSILATTEGKDCEYPRGGEDRRGPNIAGAYAILKLDDERGMFNIGDMGKSTSEYSFKQAPWKEHDETPKQIPRNEQSLEERAHELMKKQFESKKALHPDLYEYWLRTGRNKAHSDVIHKKDKALRELVETLENDTHNLTIHIIKNKKFYLEEVIPKTAHKYVRRGFL